MLTGAQLSQIVWYMEKGFKRNRSRWEESARSGHRKATILYVKAIVHRTSERKSDPPALGISWTQGVANAQHRAQLSDILEMRGSDVRRLVTSGDDLIGNEGLGIGFALSVTSPPHDEYCYCLGQTLADRKVVDHDVLLRGIIRSRNRSKLSAQTRL